MLRCMKGIKTRESRVVDTETFKRRALVDYRGQDKLRPWRINGITVLKFEFLPE
jgi:hypothetical protein